MGEKGRDREERRERGRGREEQEKDKRTEIKSKKQGKREREREHLSTACGDGPRQTAIRTLASLTDLWSKGRRASPEYDENECRVMERMKGREGGEEGRHEDENN